MIARDDRAPPETPAGSDAPRLSVRHLSHTLEDGRRVLDGISLDVRAGEVVALVGESGSGKSTLARLLCGLTRLREGEVLLDGRPLRRAGTHVQMVFQDPFASLNPVHTVEHHLLRPLALRLRQPVAALRAEAGKLLASVGLPPPLADRHPHALSGGQRQRVAIARALASAPEVLIADEPTSMLDVSTRLDVLRLLRRLTDERRLGLLLITHDLPSAAAIADRVLTLHAGRIVESGPTLDVLRGPAHPYTRLLLSAVPRGERFEPAHEPAPIRSLPDPPAASRVEGTRGCAFLSRCPKAFERCHTSAPVERAVRPHHLVRCHLYPEGAS